MHALRVICVTLHKCMCTMYTGIRHTYSSWPSFISVILAQIQEEDEDSEREEKKRERELKLYFNIYTLQA